jgi:hypothetical protein
MEAVIHFRREMSFCQTNGKKTTLPCFLTKKKITKNGYTYHDIGFTLWEISSNSWVTVNSPLIVCTWHTQRNASQDLLSSTRSLMEIKCCICTSVHQHPHHLSQTTLKNPKQLDWGTFSKKP